MKKFKYEIETDNDFEKGCCYDCPLFDSFEDKCQIGYFYEKCPLEEITE